MTEPTRFHREMAERFDFGVGERERLAQAFANFEAALSESRGEFRASERQGGEPGQRAQATFQKARYGLTGRTSDVDWETASPANRRAWAAVEAELSQPAPSADAAWVACSERMPDTYTLVQFHIDGWPRPDARFVGRWDGTEWRDDTDTDSNGVSEVYLAIQVTQWRPLPAPPEVKP